MKNIKTLAGLASAAVLSLGMSLQVNAVPVDCTNGPVIDLVNVGCIASSGDIYMGDSLYSPPGGDSEAAVEAAILAATGGAVDLTQYGKSDDDAALFSFTGVDPASTSGTWDVLDDSIQIAYITVKAATSYVLYDVQGVNNGVFSTEGITNKNGKLKNVSHISFWTTGGGTGPDPVPEPSTALLLSLGLLGFAATRRRRQV